MIVKPHKEDMRYTGNIGCILDTNHHSPTTYVHSVVTVNDRTDETERDCVREGEVMNR